MIPWTKMQIQLNNFIFKRDLASASKDLICCPCPVSPSVKIYIISCHINNFVSVCNLEFRMNSSKNSQKNSPKILKNFFKKLPKNSYSLGRNPFWAYCLPAFYLIMCGGKTHFSKLALKWCIFRHEQKYIMLLLLIQLRFRLTMHLKMTVGTSVLWKLFK